ncbi:transcription-repair coupling factor [Thermodesulfobacteriota bacterium]
MAFQERHLKKIKDWIHDDTRSIRVSGLSGSARVFFVSRLLAELDRPCLIVLPQAKAANRFYRELEFFLPRLCTSNISGERRLYDIPIYDISPLTGLSPHKDVVTRRLQGLYSLTAEPNPIIVSSIEALISKVLPKKALIKSLEFIEVGEELDRDELLHRLHANGYLRTSLVEDRGDYSVRGGVIDIFPPLRSQPVRLEFWGDHLESLRLFDPLSQRSTGHLEEIVLLPASEIILEPGNIDRARSMGRLPGDFNRGESFPGQEAWLNHFYTTPDTLFDYLPPQGFLTLIDFHLIDEEAGKFSKKFNRDVDKYRQEAEDRKNPFPEIEGLLLSDQEMLKRMEAFRRLDLCELDILAESGPAHSMHISGALQIDEPLDIRILGKGKVSMAPLAGKVSEWLGSGARVVLVCRTEQQAHRLKEILENYQVSVGEVVTHWQDISSGKGISICLGRLSKGFAWQERGLYVVSEDEIFGQKRSGSKAVKRRHDGGLNWTAFSQLQVGDFIVHEDHGIGRYDGLYKMEIEETVNDFIVIEYANNDRLYLPAERVSILQKYVGASDKNPKLDGLGGRTWKLVRQKAKRSIEEIAKQILEIYALRKYRKGFAFSKPDTYYREFEATFEHEETPDQIKAIEDILSDMESDRPMDRLVCGDVGFGKTEVALRAAFKAVMDGKQAALLVPTTVLAEQHYATFSERMKPYQISIGVLSRFKTRKEQAEIIAKVRSGKIDILIGTHRILQKDIKFKELGLLIVDEEQRFGVNQKERLKKYRALVDVLAMTATPIPRTLHMSLMGVRDLSIIETPPQDRQAIQTYLSPFDDATVKHAIEFELERKGQVFFVHNQVQNIEEIAAKIGPLVPEARVAVAHGQMKERVLEETMLRFLRKEIDVLVCTTIIESGLDIPSTNTIIINEADKFGLSQIYQLRGRVGRAKENAYAYLLISKNAKLSKAAGKRLQALMDFTHLGAGIHLAMHDLKIRGGGNILGYTQSGHITAIGYELYLKLIEQSITELKGEEWQEEINPEISVNLPAYIPSEYVSDMDVRLNLYRRLSGLKEESELKEITDEIEDRFGSTPPEVSNLLSVMAVRLMLKRIRGTRLEVGKKGAILVFSPDTRLTPETVVKFVGRDSRRFQFLSERKLRIQMANASPSESFENLKEIIRQLMASQ